MSSDLTSDLLQFNFTMPNGSKNGMYSFDRFRLDSEKLMLYRDEDAVTLPPKIVKTLAVLIENRGSILSKDELIEKVWDDSIVEESNLSQNLYILRKTLGPKPDGGQYIETLRRRGYRFNANVETHSRIEPAPKNSSKMPSVHLIGREKEIDEVTELLSREGVRLVTVSGVGGVGKTTLAKAVAEKIRGEREIFFVELAAITRPELVVSMIAAALGVRDSGNESQLDRINEILAGRTVLLILDNFEQVVSASPILSELAASANEGLKILVTSRVALRIKTESIYVVPPLQVPEWAAHAPFSDIASYEAVSLYVERAKQAQPKFELRPENASDVANICSQLGGLPLAIELAAARMRLMSPEAVLKRLRKKLDFLEGANRDVPQRQQTMRETISWSFDLLADQEKAVFARLGVFSGGFDLAAAEFLCSELGGDSSSSLLNIITSLVEHNLLAARTARNGEPRIYMLEVLREFAEEALIEKGEIDDARASHARYFVQLGEQAEPQLLAARSAEWLDRLETERDNLRSALEWAADHDPPLGQRLAGAIWRFWWLHGHIREACEQLGTFLAHLYSDPDTRAKMLIGATFLNRLAGNSERSRIYAEEGVNLASSTGDLRTAALSLNQLGFLALDVANFGEAERMFERGLKRAEELGDIQVLALLNNGLGELSRSRGDYQRAAEFYGRALEYNREAGDRVRQTTCLINLGATALMQDDRESAGEFYRNGLEISSQMEDMNGTLYCLEGIAGSLWALHDPKRASLLFGAAHVGRYKNDLLLEPADQIPYEESIALVRESIGSNLFDSNFSKGGTIDLQSAIAMALENPGLAAASIETESGTDSFSRRNENVTVERQGNVLRLVDWEPSHKRDAGISATTSVVQVPGKGVRNKFVIPFAIAAAAVAMLSIFFLYARSGNPGKAEKRNELTIERLTNGVVPFGATISPDGNYIAYHELDGEICHTYVQLVGQASRNEVAASTEKSFASAAFSNDGRFVYFVSIDKKDRSTALVRVPTIGGPMTKIIEDVNGPISFSPDGGQFAFLRINLAEKESELVVADVDGKKERTLLKRKVPFGLSGGVAWAPNGKLIAFSDFGPFESPNKTTVHALAVDVESGEETSISREKWANIYRIAWLSDGSGYVFVGTRVNEAYSSRRDQVYLVSYPEGESRRLTSDGNRHEPESLGVSRSGAILAVPGNRSSQIWVMNANGDERTASQITRGAADGRAGLASLPDARIAFIARTGEEMNIWIANAAGSDAHQVADNFGVVEELRADPQGRFLVFSSQVDGVSRLFRIGTDGSGLRQLTSGEGYEIDSAISPDGNSIVFGSPRGEEKRPILFKIPSEGGEPTPLGNNECSRPHYSFDGSMISCTTPSNEILILNAENGSPIKRFPIPAGATTNFGVLFTPDNKGVIMIRSDKGAGDLWVFPVNDSQPFRLTNFTSGTIYRYAFSSDGTLLYLARGYPTQDATLITNYK